MTEAHNSMQDTLSWHSCISAGYLDRIGHFIIKNQAQYFVLSQTIGQLRSQFSTLISSAPPPRFHIEIVCFFLLPCFTWTRQGIGPALRA